MPITAQTSSAFGMPSSAHAARIVGCGSPPFLADHALVVPTIAQALDVRDALMGLQNEDEALGRGIAPVLECGGGRQAAERVVDLDGVESRRALAATDHEQAQRRLASAPAADSEKNS